MSCVCSSHTHKATPYIYKKIGLLLNIFDIRINDCYM